MNRREFLHTVAALGAGLLLPKGIRAATPAPAVDLAAAKWWADVKKLIGIIDPGIDALEALDKYPDADRLRAEMDELAEQFRIVFSGEPQQLVMARDGTAFFVDWEHGNDANDGFTPDTALATTGEAWIRCSDAEKHMVYVVG